MAVSVKSSAQDEILDHIKNLDREESWLKKQASNARVKADDLDRKAGLMAAKRRQYEFLLGQLADPNPTDARDPFLQPVTSNVIAQL